MVKVVKLTDKVLLATTSLILVGALYQEVYILMMNLHSYGFLDKEFTRLGITYLLMDDTFYLLAYILTIWKW